MKTYLNIALLTATMAVGSVAVAAGSQTFGFESTIDYPQNMQVESNAPALTRAEVVAQIPARSVNTGEMLNYPSNVQNGNATTALTRDSVRSDLSHAMANGYNSNRGLQYPGVL